MTNGIKEKLKKIFRFRDLAAIFRPGPSRFFGCFPQMANRHFDDRVVYRIILKIRVFSNIGRLHVTLESTHIDAKRSAIERSHRVDMIFKKTF